jgi:hypothetical protein
VSRRSGSRRAGVRFVALAVLVMLALTTTASAHQREHGRHRFDLVASAQPSDAQQAVTDEAYDVSRSGHRFVDANTVATSAATCDGCRGTARAVQVLDARRSHHVHADNVATAWASCEGCGGDVVSVQLVLVGSRPDLTVNNRALAVNAGCTGCDTSAAAYQVVMSARGWVDLDNLRDEVLAWVRATPAPGGKASMRSLAPGGGEADARLADLEQLATDRTGGDVVSGSVQLRDGR